MLTLPVAAHPDPRPSRARQWWTDPYLYLAALVLVLLLPVALELLISADIGIHMATIERLHHDFTNPGNPMVAADTPSTYYSPWTCFLALLTLAFGWSTQTVLTLGAVIALPTLLIGVYRFSRVLSQARWAPTLGLLCFTLLWGTTTWGVGAGGWSGFLAWGSWATSLSYPSTIAWGLGLNLVAWLPGLLRKGCPLPQTVVLALGAGVLALVHQFTAAFIALAMMAFIASAAGGLDRPAWRRLGLGVAVTAALVLFWPYYHVWSLSDDPALDRMHLALYRTLWERYGFALLGLPALVLRGVRDKRDPLVWLFIACTALYIYGGLSHHYSYARFVPGAMAALQFALAVELAEWRITWLSWILAPLTAAALLTTAWTERYVVQTYTHEAVSALLHDDTPRYSRTSGFGWMQPYVPYGGVVMTDSTGDTRAPGYGFYVVYCPYPDSFLSDADARRTATFSYFDPATDPAQRLGILKQYHAGWVLASPTQARVSGLDRDPDLRFVKQGPDHLRLYRALG